MNRKPSLRPALADDAGSTLVEFALVAPLVALTMAAIIEFGAIMFSTALMEGALRDAARYGVTGYEEAGTARLDKILQIVRSETIGLVDMDTATVDVKVYPSFAAIGSGEDFVDANGNGAYDDGETFTDANGNGRWDSDVGVSGAGGSGEVVLYRIRYDWPLLTPIVGRLIGRAGTFPLGAAIAVRNEPWDEED